MKLVGCKEGQICKFFKGLQCGDDKENVDEAMGLEYFCWVVAIRIYEEMKELQEAHDSWMSYEEALL